MVRVKKRWNRDAGPRSVPQMANAIGATVWKLAADVVLNLENENFETDTQAQRVDIMEEVICYLAHVCDRWVYPRADQEQRAGFVSALVRDMARMLEDSRVDVQGEGEYQAAFLIQLQRGRRRQFRDAVPSRRPRSGRHGRARQAMDPGLYRRP
jgi:hypothetical protein